MALDSAGMSAKRLSALCAVFVSLCGCSTTHGVAETLVARKSASGTHPVVTVIGVTGRIRHASIHVNASPRGRVTGGWSMTCQLGSYGDTRDAGDLRGRTPLRVALPVPHDYQQTCRVTGRAWLDGSGRLAVAVFAAGQ